MEKTQRGEYKFTTKEYSEGTPWIAAEPLGNIINFPGDGFLGFDLKRGTDLNEAKEIAKFMNDNLSAISLTTTK